MARYASEELLDPGSNSAQRNWYHEQLAGNDSLLVTVGDSWTWGDSLHGINPDVGVWDDPKRLTSIYGHLLSAKLGSDFVNIAECGGSNIKMCDRAARLLELAVPQYKKIYVVITLTELGRESDWDTIWNPKVDRDVDVNSWLKAYEAKMFATIKENLIDQYPDVIFVVARNFTYSFEDNTTMLGNCHAGKTWIDCLAEAQNKLEYPNRLRFVTSMSIVPLIKTF